MIRTCGDCALRDFKALDSHKALPGAWYCSRVGGQRLVPQETGSKQSVFKRVPEWCPLPKDQAIKSPEARPACDWHTERLSNGK